MLYDLVKYIEYDSTVQIRRESTFGCSDAKLICETTN